MLPIDASKFGRPRFRRHHGKTKGDVFAYAELVFHLQLLAAIQALEGKNLAQTLASAGVVAFLFPTIVESYSLSPAAQKLMLPMLPCAFILIAAYPVFLLVWFMRSRVRQEVSGWKLPREQI